MDQYRDVLRERLTAYRMARRLGLSVEQILEFSDMEERRNG